MFVNLCRLLREKLHLGGNPSPPNPPLEGEGSKALEPSPSRGGQGGDGVATGIDWTPRIDTTLKEPSATVLIPGARIRYLAEIAAQGPPLHAALEKQAEANGKATGRRKRG